MADAIDYQAILVDAFEKFTVLVRKQTELGAEMARLRQFIYATLNMLPEAQRLTFQAELADMAAEIGGLTDAVREALKLATLRGTYFTAAQVRDHLVNAGFDFSGYSSNPLASINTTIKRFKSSVETTSPDGVAAYRWIFRFPRESDEVKAKAEKIRQIKIGAGRLGGTNFRPGTYVEKKDG